VSADGRWASLGEKTAAGMVNEWFFDLKKRDFVATARTDRDPESVILYIPYPRGYWTPEQLLCVKTVGRFLDSRGLMSDDEIHLLCFAVNALKREGEFLYGTRADQSFLTGALLDRSGSRLALMMYSFGLCFEIANLEAGGGPFIIGDSSFDAEDLPFVSMLDAGRTFAVEKQREPDGDVSEVAGLEYLAILDPDQETVREIEGLHEKFTFGTNSTGTSSGSLTLCYLEILGLEPDKRCARLVATFLSDSDSGSSPALLSRVHDLDLATEAVQPVLDLAPDSVYGSGCVLSPSQESLVVALDRETVPEDSEPTTIGLALQRMNGERRLLPFGIYPCYITEMFGREYPAICGVVEFADDNTLLYTSRGFGLWQFDLETWQSELLWRPER
jgi:hypothetical protein